MSMKKVFHVLIFFIFLSLSSNFIVRAFNGFEIENSDPYISLSADKNAVQPGQELTFHINYGNKGPEIAENVKITLNQPLDGRSPFIFVSSSPVPDKWLTSEFGNLPEYYLEELNPETDEEEILPEKIELTVQVRNSTPDQELIITASIQAPNKKAGERLSKSNELSIQIGKEKIKEATEAAFENNSTSSGIVVNSAEKSAFTENKVFPKTNKQQNFLDKLYKSEAIWTTIIFMVISFLLILSFLAGRKSKRG